MKTKNVISVLPLLLLLTSAFTSTVSASTIATNGSNRMYQSPFAWNDKYVSGSETYGGSSPEVAYGAGRFGVVFNDERDGNSEIYFSLLRHNGRKIGQDLRITNDPGNSRDPTIAWNGRSFGIFWYDNPVGDGRGIYYAAVSRKGKLLTGPVRVNNPVADGVHPSALWNKENGEYAVVWWDSRVGGTYFARVDRNGNTVLEAPVSTLGPSGYYRPRLATNGDEYAIVWGEGVPCVYGTCPEMAFAKVDSLGNKIGNDEVKTAYGATRPKTIVWNGEGYDVLVGLGHYAKLLKLSSDGTILQPPIDLALVMMSNAEMVWDGEKYGLTWISGQWVTPEYPTNGELVFQSFDAAGNLLSEPVRITNNTVPCWNSSPLIWTGSSYAVVWVESLYEPDQAIYFAQGR